MFSKYIGDACTLYVLKVCINTVGQTFKESCPKYSYNLTYYIFKVDIPIIVSGSRKYSWVKILSPQLKLPSHTHDSWLSTCVGWACIYRVAEVCMVLYKLRYRTQLSLSVGRTHAIALSCNLLWERWVPCSVNTYPVEGTHTIALTVNTLWCGFTCCEYAGYRAVGTHGPGTQYEPFRRSNAFPHVELSPLLVRSFARCTDWVIFLGVYNYFF